jgi:DNA-binding transcriptional LysR family regulator
LVDNVLLSDMGLFVAVARAKSFTRAAQALHVPTSTLSRRVAELEKKLGLRLLNRTTRTLEVTDEGLHYLHHVERLLVFANEIHEDLQNRGRNPTGILRVSLPESVAMQLAIPWFAEFAELYPELRIEIDTAPDHIDQVADNFDICIYYHPVPDSSLTVRRLASFSRALCASPRYIAARGMPSHPSELAAHQCICAGDNSVTQHRWTLTRGTERFTVDISGAIATRSLVLAPEFAKSGIGIASAMLQAFPDDIAAGRLIPVLPDWEAEPLLLSAIIPHKVMPAKTRLFLDFFAQKMKIQKAAMQAV